VVSIMPHLAIQRKRPWWLLAAAIVALLAVPPPKRPATTPVIVRQLRVPVGAEALTVGAAELPLPIPADAHLAGYGPFRKAKGVRDAPMARALVIGPWVVVTLDVLEVSPELVAAIREKTPSAAALFVLATHTHSGPGGTDPNVIAQLLGEGPFHRDLLEAFAATAAQVVAKAQASARPAVLSLTHSNVPGLQEERTPGGTPDPSLSVLTAKEAGGTPIATLAVFGAHPTLLPRQEQLLSVDWPGAAVRELEKDGGIAMVARAGTRRCREGGCPANQAPASRRTESSLPPPSAGPIRWIWRSTDWPSPRSRPPCLLPTCPGSCRDLSTAPPIASSSG